MDDESSLEIIKKRYPKGTTVYKDSKICSTWSYIAIKTNLKEFFISEVTLCSADWADAEMKTLCTNQIAVANGKFYTNITDSESVEGITGVGLTMGIEEEFYLVNHEPSTTGSSISLSVLACFLNCPPSMIYSGCMTEEGETDEMDSDVVMVKVGAVKRTGR